MEFNKFLIFKETSKLQATKSQFLDERARVDEMAAEPVLIVLGSQSQCQDFRKVKHGNFNPGRAANLQVELAHGASRDHTMGPGGHRTGDNFINQRIYQVRVRSR